MKPSDWWKRRDLPVWYVERHGRNVGRRVLPGRAHARWKRRGYSRFHAKEVPATRRHWLLGVLMAACADDERGRAISQLFPTIQDEQALFNPSIHRRSMTATLQTLPSEILRGIIAFLTGFDRLRLAHTSARFYRELLVDASHWSDAHDVTTLQAKQTYVRASSLQFPAQTRAGFSSGERGACVPVLRFFPGRKYGRPTSELFLPLSPRFFSIDLWFSLLPSKETDVFPGGVLLGAQSVRLQDAFAYADYHQPFVWVDPSLSLSCSILDDDVEAHETTIVKPTLRTQQWYHLALTFDNGAQSVFLNGELLHTRHGDLHRDWRSLYYMQLGSGCVTGDCIGLDDTAAATKGWYGFHGVVDNFRVWAEALGVDDVRRLAQGHALTTSTPLSSLEECNREDWCGPVKRVRCSRPYEQVCIVDSTK